MPDIKSIADKADIIVNGYAFTREDDAFMMLQDRLHRVHGNIETK